MPGSIEAVFYIRGATSCQSSNGAAGQIAWETHGQCKQYALAAHRAILSYFGLSPRQLPLLRLDLTNFARPFDLSPD